MTDKELKRLSRTELLEMLLAQAEENEKLKVRLEEMQTRLDNRRIILEEAGSIAEAALQLNGVFQAAEAAAAQYLENIRRLGSEKESVCQQIEAEAMEKAEAVRREADAYSCRVRAEADRYRGEAEEKIQSLPEKQEADRYQSEAEKKVQDLPEKQDGAPAPRRSRRRGRKKA